MLERNSLLWELWDFSFCRPFTCTKTYNTLQESENVKTHNRASSNKNIPLFFLLMAGFNTFRINDVKNVHGKQQINVLGHPFYSNIKK